MELKVLAIQSEPRVLIDKSTDKTVYSGIYWNILNILSHKLSFRYNVSSPKDEIRGSRFKNGTWTGVIGMLQSNEGDIGMNLFFLDYYRFQAADQIYPIEVDSYRILSAKPEAITDLAAVFEEIENEVWILLFISILVVALLSTLLERKIPKNCSSIFWGFVSSIQDLLKSLLTYPPDEEPTTDSLRILQTFWYMGAVVILMNYLGGLFETNLVTYKEGKSIKSLEDLLESDWKHVKLTLPKGGKSVAMFKNAKRPPHSLLWPRAIGEFVELRKIKNQMLEIAAGKRAMYHGESFIKCFVLKFCGKVKGRLQIVSNGRHQFSTIILRKTLPETFKKNSFKHLRSWLDAKMVQKI